MNDANGPPKRSLGLHLVQPQPPSETTHTDPVCGMAVEPAAARGSFAFQGVTYYFCAPSCLQKFRADPERYLHNGPIGHDVPAIPGAEYFCPMDPEVISDRPAACPKCGMALEPRTVVLNEGPSPELVDFTRRLKVGLLLGVPLMVLAMGPMLPTWTGLPTMLAPLEPWNGLLQLLLATPVVFWCGLPFYARAWNSVVRMSLNMFTLIALGVTAAYVYSVVAVFSPGVFPEAMRHHGYVEGYFESAAAIIVLVLLGQMLEQRARGQTSAALRRLLGLAPKTARLVGPGGQESDVPIELVQPGDVLRIRPGEKVPVDGVVIEGNSALDESMITGEPIPVEKDPGTKLIAGTLNGTGSLLVRAERVGSTTLLAQIVRLVGEAQRSRAPVQKLVDRVAAWFVPAVLLIAVLTFVGWLGFDPEPDRLARAVVHAVAVLLIACPCALGLATPMAVMVGVGKGAEEGVLIRDAEALEVLHRADTLVVDKTGTLTEGKPKLVTVEPAEGMSADELLRLAAGLEKASEHPLASAIVAGARGRGLSATDVHDFTAVTGRGVVGGVDGQLVLLGNAAFLAERGIDADELAVRAEELRREGQTVLFAAVDGRMAGLLGVADPIRESTPEALQRLRTEGLRVIMLTGDSRTTAEAVARRLGIDEVHAEALPAAKADVIRRLQTEGRVVAMAGDGVNDAPALAAASVGLAMGTGTDVAMESAGVTLVRGDLRAVARARRLSRLTVQAIRQNLVLAFAYNVLAVPLAALGFLTPVLAAAAMSLSSLSVVANALRLRSVRL